MKRIEWKTGTAIVIANMVGTGIFTSLGFQLVSTTNTWSIILLWSLGAIMALCGALSYAELGTLLKRSGGEYHFLSQTYHPLVGYLSGWVSLTVGFAAPVALAAMALGEYTGIYLGVSPTILAVIVAVLVSVFHSFSLNTSSKMQNLTTSIKVLLIIGFILCGFMVSSPKSAFDWSGSWQTEILMPAYAVSFVYVTFSYSGWNAASYIVDEIKDVQRNLPRSLVLGTLLVSVLYLLLNIVFLRQGSVDALSGQLEIGQIVAINMFGDFGGRMISLAIGVMLVSSISAMVWTGPRVTQVMAEDYKMWSWFAIKNKNAIPIRAIWLQASITILLILTGSFEQVLLYSGFVLQLFGALAVSAVFIIRKQGIKTNSFKSPLYPIPQVIFLILSVWVLSYLAYSQTTETVFGILNLAIGCLLYFINKLFNK